MSTQLWARFMLVLCGVWFIAACAANTPKNAPAEVASGSAAPLAAQADVFAPPLAPSPDKTSGFDGGQAYVFTAQLVGFGPRPPASDAIHRTQDYLLTRLKSFGCAVDQDDFHASTPIGDLAMKNIVAKIPGTGQGIILLLTHYDTLRKDNFVGAVDGGSSTGLMLEIARIECAKKQPNAVWIAFLDGEEALVDWYTNNDNTYGSRQLAARLAMSGELKRVRAVILADMVGPKNLRIRKDSNSTPWLTSLVWETAGRLGYKDVFMSQDISVDDDHVPFLRRGIPSVDLIDLQDFPYWHTTEDTLDKVSPQSLAIVGHVVLESVSELQKKFR